MGALIARFGSGYQLKRLCLQDNLRNCVMDLASGNRSLLLRATGVNGRTFDAWLSGAFLPELSNLLSFCHRLGIPILRLASETLREGDADWERARELVSQHAVGKRRSRKEVRRLLEHELRSPEGRPLAEIAADLGYRGVVSLRRHAPDLYTMISNRARSKTKTREPKRFLDQGGLNREIRERLESALRKSKPPSVLSVAKEFGFCHSRSLHHRFPDLCKKLVTAGTRARLEHRLQIEAALRAALVENPAPTLKTIAQRLGRKYITSLQRWFPELCGKLTERWRQGRDERIRVAGDALQAALEHQPTVSADIVAERYGISSNHLARLFPEAWRKLNAQFTAAKKQQFAEKREALRREVRRVVLDLCGQGKYPTLRCVSSLLVTSDYRSENVIASEIDQTVAKYRATEKGHPRLAPSKRL
jgi:AraC-like DNA-binding protein